MRAIREIEARRGVRAPLSAVTTVYARPEPARVRVLLVDDHSLLRQGLAALIDSRDGYEVVGQAGNGQEAVEMARQLRPDVVLMDIAMPVMNGIDATREITKQVPGVRVLVLSTPSYADQLLPILRAGASGYLLKDADAFELFHAIDAVNAGHAYFSPQVSSRMMHNLFLVERNGAKGMEEPLSTREREIVDLVADGCSNQEIAQRLCVSVKTVEAHKSHIIAKLGLKGTIDLVRYAVRRQMMDLDA